MSNEPIIRHSYQFPNVHSPVWLISWNLDDDGSSTLSGLVVKFQNRNRLKYCVMIILVVRRQMIMVISKEADKDKRLI